MNTFMYTLKEKTLYNYDNNKLSSFTNYVGNKLNTKTSITNNDNYIKTVIINNDNKILCKEYKYHKLITLKDKYLNKIPNYKNLDINYILNKVYIHEIYYIPDDNKIVSEKLYNKDNELIFMIYNNQNTDIIEYNIYYIEENIKVHEIYDINNDITLEKTIYSINWINKNMLDYKILNNINNDKYDLISKDIVKPDIYIKESYCEGYSNILLNISDEIINDKRVFIRTYANTDDRGNKSIIKHEIIEKENTITATVYSNEELIDKYTIIFDTYSGNIIFSIYKSNNITVKHNIVYKHNKKIEKIIKKKNNITTIETYKTIYSKFDSTTIYKVYDGDNKLIRHTKTIKNKLKDGENLIIDYEIYNDDRCELSSIKLYDKNGSLVSINNNTLNIKSCNKDKNIIEEFNFINIGLFDNVISKIKNNGWSYNFNEENSKVINIDKQ